MRTIILISILIITSCTPPVVFDQAYPSDQDDLISIPVHYQGVFICESDSSLVIISDFHITRHMNHYFDTNIKNIKQQENCNIKGDSIYIKGRKECIPISVIDDGVVRGTYQEIDTLFRIQKGSVARIHNGHLVINQEINPREWAVSLLTPELGSDITYRAITNKTELQHVADVTQLKDITTAKDESPRYKIRPTMKEFNDLLEDDKVFIECEYLVRIQLENLLLN